MPAVAVAMAAPGARGSDLPALARQLQEALAAAARAEQEARNAAALLELTTRMVACAGVPAACQLLVNQLRLHLGCDRIAIGLRRSARGGCRLTAVSGLADFDCRCEMARDLEAALNEALVRDTPVVLPAQHNSPVPATLAHQRLSRHPGSARLLSAPLHTADGTLVGAWIFLGAAELAEQGSARHFVDAAAEPVAVALEAVRKAQPGRVGRMRRLLLGEAARGRRWFGLLAAALLGALFLPLPYRIGVECELQPITRRYVAAPHAGVFAHSLVKPGDMVRRDQILARMDAREIRMELSGVIADGQRAAKSRDVNMAAGKVAAAQIDELEMERLESKRALLAQRIEHLDVKSPINGLVLSGDLQRSEGVPVTVGQVLYEVAPLERLIAEVAIPDEEISHVAPAMDVAIALDAGGAIQHAPLDKIHPRSVVREKDNVFLAEVVLNNSPGTLRPGMKGQARIRTAERSLGWIVLHRPWNYLRLWLDF